MTNLRGQCMCGNVAYEARDPRPTVNFCHCSQCRRTSGHYWAATTVATENLNITQDAGLRWFQSSDRARRGFCKDCGASVFFDPAEYDVIAIGVGTLDQPTGLGGKSHIFAASKPDYYDFPDDLPRIEA